MRTLSKRIMIYLNEYLGEFEFIFETILDYESRTRCAHLMPKNRQSKISCLGTFKGMFWTRDYNSV